VDFQPYRAPDIATLVDTWLPLSNALNSLSRTMGQSDIYPFILSPAIIKKLGTIHDLIHGDPLATHADQSPPVPPPSASAANPETVQLVQELLEMDSIKDPQPPQTSWLGKLRNKFQT
jgi:hypothetical protein